MELTPITRKENFLAKAAGDQNALDLEPITREEWFISQIQGGGGGSVTSVNGKTGAVVLTAADLDDSFKDALLDCFANAAWATEDGQQYYDALEATLYPIDHITAVYTQSGTVYDTDSLDSLKADLVVTAFYQGGGSKVVTDYTLSGTLTEGTSTITVSYGGKTTSFDVIVADDFERYQQVEWIEAKNGPAINTLNSLTVNSEIRCGMQRMGEGVLANGESYFGRTSPSVIMMRAQNGNIFANFLRASSASFSGSLDSSIHVMILNKTKFSLDGVDKATFSGDMQDLNQTRHVMIFAWPEDDSDKPHRMVWARCSYFQIYDNGNLVTDLVPCYRKADGEIGMYDRVQRAFRTNVGSGTFTKGADV